MAIYRHTTRETPDPHRPGVILLAILDELEEQRCYVCGDEAFPSTCTTCRKYHHHGEIHAADGSLKAVCRAHGA